jgi:SAM-dependent methyltransferase
MSFEPEQTTEGDQDEPDWAAYYRHTLGREPRPLFTKGMAAASAVATTPGRAVEIGFGDGTETLALLASGWSVLAIDPTPEAAGVLRSRVPEADAGRLTIETASGELVDLPPFDLLYSGYALSFLQPAAFSRFWANLRDRLRPGGLIVLNIFGVRDTWAGDSSMTFLDSDAVRDLLDGFEVIAIDEEDQDGNSFTGAKHWHVFDVIARRPVLEQA